MCVCVCVCPARRVHITTNSVQRPTRMHVAIRCVLCGYVSAYCGLATCVCVCVCVSCATHVCVVMCAGAQWVYVLSRLVASAVWKRWLDEVNDWIAHRWTHKHIHTQTDARTRAHKHTHTHTHTHIYTHTQTHTQQRAGLTVRVYGVCTRHIGPP